MRPYLTLHDPSRAREYYSQGLWQSDTFYALLCRHAKAYPTAWALRDGRRRLSWIELQQWVDGVADAFRGHGLVAGDRVSIWMSNKAEAIASFLACSREGFACNPSLHKTYRAAEIARLLQRLDSALLVSERNWGADQEEIDLADELAHLDNLKYIYDLETFPTAGSVPKTAPANNPDAVSYLAFTSGTTGEPKCVMHSDNTLLANARDMVRDWSVDRTSKLLTLSPLSHHIAWVAVAQWLVAGSEIITNDPPESVTALDWVEQTGATYVMGVPTHAMDILAELHGREMPTLGRVKVFYMAGAAIPPSVAQAFAELGIKPQNVYGMTENSSHHYTHPDDHMETVLKTCGRGSRAYRITILDKDNPQIPAPAGAVGQIAGYGAALMLGYFGNQAATEASFNRDGLFLSGDLGSLDEQGNLHVQGRMKDLIVRGGHNIYPTDIEALALRHPAVERCAVFPVPDDRLGERVCIAVVGAIDATTLLDHLNREGLSKYHMPEFFVTLPEFPLTASGKILKRALIDMQARGAFRLDPVRWAGDAEKLG